MQKNLSQCECSNEIKFARATWVIIIIAFKLRARWNERVLRKFLQQSFEKCSVCCLFSENWKCFCKRWSNCVYDSRTEKGNFSLIKAAVWRASGKLAFPLCRTIASFPFFFSRNREFSDVNSRIFAFSPLFLPVQTFPRRINTVELLLELLYI